jgi:hypothetical protein
MPRFNQGGNALVRLGAITPVTGARAGTVNDAGGFMSDIDCRDYKAIYIQLEAGVVGTSVDLVIKDSATVGGSYVAHKTRAGVDDSAITQIVAGPAHQELSRDVTVGRPYLQVAMTTVGATTAAGLTFFGVNPMSTSRV